MTRVQAVGQEELGGDEAEIRGADPRRERDRCVDGADGDEHRRDGRQAWQEAKRDRRDRGERALAADDVVELAGARRSGAPVDPGELQGLDLPAHRSVRERTEAAGVGRDHAAERRRVP